MSSLARLFEPLAIGPMRVENRIMMSGMSAGMMLDAKAHALPEMRAYYAERARSRPGMIAIGASAVVPPPDPARMPLALYDDDCLPSLSLLVDAVHRYETKLGIQLWDGGTQTGGRYQLSPSAVPANAQAVFDLAREQPILKALSLDEISQVVGYFAAGATRCMQAGFDFVEIHAGHGYLISAFLAPYFNRRTDGYGGSFENRIRFLVEILRAVKSAVGHRLGVGVKINGDDFMPNGGWTLDESCRLAPVLEAEGADYISVTAGVMGAPRLTVPPMYEKQGCFADLAAAVKKQVSIPVASVGRIKDPAMANALIADGSVDIACMGRAMIADSEIVAKAREGRLDDIRPCLAECRGCIDQEMRAIKRGEPGSVSCVVNPRMQRESVCIDVEGTSKDNPKRILIVGAGLAGLEAARRAAFSGHHVTLCESRNWIGGQIRYAAMIPGRREIGDIVPWYERQLAKYGVEIRLGTEIGQRELGEMTPDVVIAATGSVPIIPQDMLQSIYNANRIEIALIDDILDGGLTPGRNILVIGGDQIGMQAADFLSEGGSTVIVAESQGKFAQKLAANDRWYLTARLIQKNVRRLKNVRAIGIDAEEQVSLVLDGGTEMLPDIDMIVFAAERRSVRSVSEFAKAAGIETYTIGDARDVITEDSGTIFATIAEAYDLARRL